MNDLEYWLALINAPGIGPSFCSKLLKKFTNPQTICTADYEQLAACGLKANTITALQNPDAQLIAQQCHWAQQVDQTILTLDHPDYPPLLKNIYDPPPVLFIRGQVKVLSYPQLAIVGSRNPTPQGVETAREFAAALVETGIAITSGLARGIDAAAHCGALGAAGITIAVLGSGLQRIYPVHHQRLAIEITQGGALISEFSPQTAPIAAHFPRRNRLISGLSLGTCVVEATLRSGSLITAKMAVEQGREVFAVPSSIRNPLAQGCHVLIQEGAKLVTEVGDILIELKHGKIQNPVINNISHPLELDSNSHQLLQCIGFEVTTIDQLVHRSGWSVDQVSAQLLPLELKGYIQPIFGGYLRIK